MAKKNRTAAKIEPPQPQGPQRIRFSFEYYDIEGDRYCLSKGSSQQVREALKRLKQVSANTFKQLQAQGEIYHFHPVDWDLTAEKDGFANTGETNSDVTKLQPFQFALLSVSGQKARVFGAYSQGIFFIVWFDLNHQIWPSFKKHT